MNADWMDESPAPLTAARSLPEKTTGTPQGSAGASRPLRWILPAVIIAALIPLGITVWNYAPLGRAWIAVQGLKIESGTPQVSGSCPGRAEWKTTDSVPMDSMGTIYRMACRKLESMAGAAPLATFETRPALSHHIVTVLQCSSGYFLVTATTENRITRSNAGTVTVSALRGTFNPHSLGPNPVKKATWELPFYFFF
jgi:hypothetical protein